MSALKFDELPDVLTVTEASRFLRLGRNRAYELVQSGDLRAVKVGRRLLVPKKSIHAFLEAGAHA